MTFRRSISRLLALVRNRRLEADLDDDIQTHLALAEDEAIARGLSPEAARYEARRQFGGITQMQEEHRDHRTFSWIEQIAKDFRYGLASLKRTPGFAVVVISVLALGIGGTVAMFSIVDAVLIKPLPFPKPEQIVAVWEAPRPGVSNDTSVPQFLAWKQQARGFATLTAELSFSAALNNQNGPIRMPGKRVTAGYFNVFGTNTILGRLFRPDEDQPGASSVVVLSHASWQTHFASDPEILTKRILLDGQSYQVIGVLAPGPFDRDDAQFWTPLVFHPAEMASPIHYLSLYARLADGVTLERATQKMQSIYASLQSNASMDEVPKGALAVFPLSRLLLGNNLQHSITVAFGAVLLVLLIACANVANLLFARGASRRTELAVRVALGAGRARLTAQLLTECLALCSLGGASGAAIAFALIRFAKPALAQALPFTADVQLDMHALLFGAALVLGVAFLTGTLPAWQASFGDVAGSLKHSARSSSTAHLKLRRSIVIGEVALSLVLVCGALLLARSLLNLQRVDTGVRIENVVTTSLSLPTDAYATPQKAALFYDSVANRLLATPGLTHVALSTALPLQWIRNGEGIFIPGIEKQIMVRLKRIDPGYLRTLDIPLLTGRAFDQQDHLGTPNVMLINQALQKRLADIASIQRPVGIEVRLTGSDYLGKLDTTTNVRIVGVIRSERTTAPGAPDPPVVYVPLAQVPNPNIKLLVRTQDAMPAVMPAIRKAIAEIDPNLPLGEVETMQQVKDATFSQVSRPAWLIGAFATIAVLLAAIGLYGVVAYSITQRRKELGIRVALGARPENVLIEVLRNALAMITAGLVIGLVGTYALTRILASLLFEVSPLDPFSLAIGCMAMAAIGVAAAYLPANKASHFDPMLSLRDEA